MKTRIIFLLFILSMLSIISKAQDKIELSGKWQFAADPLDKGVGEKWFEKSLKESVKLPGSMAENGKGEDITLQTRWTGDILDSSYFKLPSYEKYRQAGNIKVPFWLQPEKHYLGAAWYRREVKIPSEWKNKSIELLFERCHWQTMLWVDNAFIGTQNSLGAPHIFDLTGKLTPGKHFITVCVDNRIKDINPGVNSSSLTDHSQTNWNGIVGKMFLAAKSKTHLGDIRIFTDIDKKKLSVELHIINDSKASNESADISLQATPDGISPKEISFNKEVKKVELAPGENTITLDYEMGEKALLWDEFSPNIYRLSCTISGKNIEDKREDMFGFRKLGTKGTEFTLNGKPIQLRGTLECAIFPKTGYPSVDENEWARIFKVCKSYGLNHMRFHSWCPPEAAFVAADKAGMYLYVECSSWANQGASIGDGKPLDKYIQDESERMIREYGNHPSFCFMVYGNEPNGENHQKYLSKFVSYWKAKDNRRLYSSASGWPALEENDFHSMYEPRIQLWGAGLSSIINHDAPSTNYDWRNIISWRGKPVISHEIGQWCVYPNFKEIKKYDGVLHAKNFEIFKESLSENGMAEYADSFLTASGKLQVLCYKAEIEAALRTKAMGGFQLLDLHDFPGQGTALVGVLDPFWQEKGYVTSSEYTQFCNSTVPLARMTKVIFNSAEDFTASVEISHYGPSELKGITPLWTIINTKGEIVCQGKLAKTDIPLGNGFSLGEIREPLVNFQTPAMYSLIVKVGEFTNKWDFWVYPYRINESKIPEDIKIVRSLDDETVKFLNDGGKVILTPVKGTLKKEKGGDIAVGFSSIFWNTAWTQKQAPHTLGILCNPDHPMLKDFPTEFHSNYQWWDAMSHSNAIILNELGKDIKPVVRVIDDWFTNRPLGLIIEGQVGKGKIILSGIDLLTDAEKRPEARQLTYSMIKYMESNSFTPKQELKIEDIKGLYNVK
ncbi:MAG: glycoside hydrolase family 2 TIM barrel-domain containing protein [Bacteroidota bacterium]|nr:glycoside hydrolase family 2 TIM barrel-domain containing protein [Bacteroidota bacterium]